jgi:hypothetical protein
LPSVFIIYGVAGINDIHKILSQDEGWADVDTVDLVRILVLVINKLSTRMLHSTLFACMVVIHLYNFWSTKAIGHSNVTASRQ